MPPRRATALLLWTGILTLGASPAAAPDGPREGVLPTWLPVDEQSGPLGYALFFGPLVVGALGLFAAWRAVRNRQRTGGVPGHLS